MNENNKPKLLVATVILWVVTYLPLLIIILDVFGFDLDYAGNFEGLGFGEWSEFIVLAAIVAFAGGWYIFIGLLLRWLFKIRQV